VNPSQSLMALSIRRSKRRRRSARSRCGRRGGRNFWRKSSRLGEICRLPSFGIESSGCVYETNVTLVLSEARSVPTTRALVSPLQTKSAPAETARTESDARFPRAVASGSGNDVNQRCLEAQVKHPSERLRESTTRPIRQRMR